MVLTSIMFSSQGFFLCGCSCEGNGTYGDVTRLMEDKLGSRSGYNDAVRPLKNQSNVLEVNVRFDLVSILELDAVQQKFVVNGFLGMSWTDEIVAWERSDYGGVFYFHPYPKQIWRPRLILGNTLEDRDLFEDDYSPLYVLNNGLVYWTPGGLYPTSCNLDLTKFPFDRQVCDIKMYSMGLSSGEIRFIPETKLVGVSAYDESGEWNIESATVMAGSFGALSYFQVRFELRRLPEFFIINIIAPVILMSFLNILVFVIPVDSGERISYGITVLLALTVFMSIVSDQLPRTSKTLPLVTVYLLALAIMGGCTVVATIFLVYCRHREQKMTSHRRATSYIKRLFHKVNPLGKKYLTAIRNWNISHRKDDVKSEPPSTVLHSLGVKDNSMFGVGSQGHQSSTKVEEDSKVYINRWRQIGKHLDFVFFVFFIFVWLSLTIGFMVVTAVD